MINQTAVRLRKQVLRASAMVGLLVTATIAGVSIVGGDDGVDAATTADISAIVPTRYVDTRSGEDTVDGRFAGTGRIAAGNELAVAVAGRPGVPADAAAVVMNVTAVRPDGPGHVTVYPCGGPRPNVSNINYRGGDVAPNAVLSKIGVGGRVCMFSLSGTDLVVDVNAYVPAGGSPVLIDPVRNVDTRRSTFEIGSDNPGRLTGGNEYRFTIAGTSGIPATAAAAAMNITAVRPDGPGHVTVYPCGTARPNVSNINYRGGDVAPNAVLSKIGTGGQICVVSLRDTDLIIDVAGYVPAGRVPTAIAPVRLADTRAGSLADGNRQAGRLDGGREYQFDIAGQAGLPVRIAAAMMNITAVRPDGPGHVTVYPCDRGRPNASSLNYQGGDVVPNAVFSKLGDDGRLCIYSLRATDVIIDVNAYVPAPGDVVTTTEVPSTTDPTTATTQPPPMDCMVAGKVVATSLPGTECEALIALYDSTDGPNWRRNDLWNTPVNPCQWKGVGCAGGHVVALRLANNDMGGPLPPLLAQLTNLREFRVDNNGLIGPIPDTVGALSELSVFSAPNNLLSQEIPASIGGLSQLTEFNVTSNLLSGSIPSVIGNLGNLRKLQLANNDLSGSIPSTIGNLKQLEDLSLYDNQLTGTIPATIGNLTNLVGLSLYGNQLTGSIPGSIANLTRLEALTVSGNRLTGPIPAWIGQLTGLKFLWLDGNRFTGSIPDLSGLTKLNWLDLSANQLTGPIPSTIGSLSGLTQLYLNDNQLVGPVPPSIKDLDLAFVRLHGNGCLTAATTDLASWLELYDPNWDDGC